LNCKNTRQVKKSFLQELNILSFFVFLTKLKNKVLKSLNIFTEMTMLTADELVELASRPHLRNGQRKRLISLLKTKIKKNLKQIELFEILQAQILQN
jgi:hypothetical protein